MSFSFFNDIFKNKNEKYNNFNSNIIIDKIKSIISLCQKYAKIMNNSMNYIEANCTTNIFHEMKNIIKQYNKFIFSDKIKNFFYENIIINNDINNDFNLKEFEPKNLNFTEKFRNKISALKNEKYKINDELNMYKKRNKFLSLEKDEMDIIINNLKKENEILNDKIKNLENIEKQYNQQKNEINKLKGQIENLNSDIKYKENTINSLQEIIEKIKINSNFITNTNKNINPQNYESGFLSDINNDSIAQDIISPKNFNVNSILSLEEDENIKKINKTEKDIKINKLNNNEEEKKMEEKIQKIDKDILDLKTKLKKIYSK